MTSTRTLSSPRQTVTAPHEHAWLIRSRHTTSEGTVLYVFCGACGIRRVDLQVHPHVPPSPLSRPVDGVTR